MEIGTWCEKHDMADPCPACAEAVRRQRIQKAARYVVQAQRALADAAGELMQDGEVFTLRPEQMGMLEAARVLLRRLEL